MGMRMPETCRAVSKRQVINLRSCYILLIDSVECMMMHGLANPKINMTQNYLISAHSIIHLLLLQNGTVNTILTQIYDNPPYKMSLFTTSYFHEIPIQNMSNFVCHYKASPHNKLCKICFIF